MDALPILTTDLGERWDCHGCGWCCRDLIVELDAEDLRRLREQGWRRHPDFRGVKIVRRLAGGGRRLNQRSDGSCVFLTSDKRCRIHQDLGHDAKPLVCRTYPLQLIPQPAGTTLSVQRSCPSAAADRGRPLEEHTELAASLADEGGLVERPPLPPPPFRWPRVSEAGSRCAIGWSRRPAKSGNWSPRPVRQVALQYLVRELTGGRLPVARRGRARNDSPRGWRT